MFNIHLLIHDLAVPFGATGNAVLLNSCVLSCGHAGRTWPCRYHIATAGQVATLFTVRDL